MGWFGWSDKADKSGENFKTSHDKNSLTTKSEKLVGTDSKHEHVWTKTSVDSKTGSYKNESGWTGENAARSRDKK